MEHLWLGGFGLGLIYGTVAHNAVKLQAVMFYVINYCYGYYRSGE